MTTALIVDDERLARENLRLLLDAHRHRVRVIGEARNVAEAEEQIAQYRPDAVFLDVQMPGGSGFDLLERLTDLPHIVFVTAYDSYAVRAFEVNAMDYLLKPIDPARLAEAIERLTPMAACPPPGNRAELTLDDQVLLCTGKQCLFVRVSHIASVRADGNYTHVTTVDGKSFMVGERFGDWQARLPTEPFVTLDRSLLVNLDHVREWTAHGRQADLSLGDAAESVRLGRTAFGRLRKCMRRREG